MEFVEAGLACTWLHSCIDRTEAGPASASEEILSPFSIISAGDLLSIHQAFFLFIKADCSAMSSVRNASCVGVGRPCLGEVGAGSCRLN